MSTTKIPAVALTRALEGKRKRGGPMLTWRRMAESERNLEGWVSWSEITFKGNTNVLTYSISKQPQSRFSFERRVYSTKHSFTLLKPLFEKELCFKPSSIRPNVVSQLAGSQLRFSNCFPADLQ
ncbi:hypothetical protein CEXT_39381 [Caerostris extrusa]|uniref:Uncharacterized protein n=1 Tax=Caerostris extrusa TaxID=172846 RepID=A0AAV4UVK8_CAEEX|nr:hypothetical protein CEXT_39381 [Caerostris extrusa]